MENKIVKTDTIWYKIKSFFRRLFSKKEKKLKQEIVEELKQEKQEDKKILFKQEITFREEIEEVNQKDKLAQELLDGKINCEELSDEEVDEMTEYFRKDIEKQEQELERIKKHILEIRKQLKNS